MRKRNYICVIISLSGMMLLCTCFVYSGLGIFHKQTNIMGPIAIAMFILGIVFLKNEEKSSKGNDDSETEI